MTEHTHDHSHDHGHGHGHDHSGHDHSDLPDVPEASGHKMVGSSASSSVALADVEEAMKDVVDPELGINVVDLGLVYGIHVDEGANLVLDMTLTSAACPLTDVITDQTNSALEGLVNDVAINWVWMPPWGPDKITPDGREQLRALGFNV
jgi:metal-sulfur cluster biosynthetic enzyme